MMIGRGILESSLKLSEIIDDSIGKQGSQHFVNFEHVGILRWAMGLTNWLETGDITLYIPITIHLLTS